jgi:bifunctional non-homologous end joining protein LigD
METGMTPARRARTGSLAYVVHKHDASTLHFDLRLELDGVMKSWAVPKGPSLDPSLKRLAMEVEDHPVSYNAFEGTIAAGQYGGGTVMLWDRGTYSAGDIRTGESEEDAIRRGLEEGKLAIVVHGDRVQGAFTLVRTRRRGKRAQWLLIKGDDAFARRGSDIVAEAMTSAASDRTMEEIAVTPSGSRSSDRRARPAAPERASRPAPAPAGAAAPRRR